MNDDEYYKIYSEINNAYYEKHKYDKFIQYIKDNHLAIIAIIISVIALFK